MSVISYQALSQTARPVEDLPPGPPRRLSTLVEVTRWRAAAERDRLAFTFLADGEEQEEHLTYGGLDLRARAIAAELQRRGASGERVLLVFNPGLEYNAAIFGCLYAGAVAVPVYPPDPFRAHRTLPRLQAIVADAEARFILSCAEFEDWTRGSLAEICGAQTIAVEDVPDRCADEWDARPPEPGDLAILQYTSGSTGSPKGVMLTHANVIHNLRSLHRVDSEDVVVVSWLPPYHDMGLIGCILLPVHSGRRVVFMSPLAFMQRPFRWLGAISRYRAKTSGAPNFGYELCVRKIAPEERNLLDLRSWTVTVNGAEPVRAETIDAFCEAFGPCGFRREAFYPAFGMAESTLLVSGGHRDDLPVERVFSARALAEGAVVPVEPGDPDAKRMIGCGQPILQSEIAIVDPRTRRLLEPGRVGEIWVRGPSIGAGYWGRPDDTRKTFRARLAGEPRRRFLRTGDLGFLHDGELFVAGRLKELIILAGQNYYPQDIELAVQRRHPALKADGGAAFSVELGGEERLAVVQEVLRPKKYDLDELLREMRAELAEQFDLSPCALALIPAGTLPKTSSGKTRRRACREMFLSGELTVLAEWRAEATRRPHDGNGRLVQQPRTPLERRLARLWTEVLGVDPVGRDDDFFALGGQSLRAVQLLGRIQNELGVDVSLPALFQRPTLAEMAEMLEAAAADGAAQARPPREAIPRRMPDEPAVLSFAEQRLWFFDQLKPGHAFYNMPAAARLRGPLSVPAFEKAVEHLVARHEMLRACYDSFAGRPLRKILPPGLAPMELVDLEHVAAAERPRRLEELLREEAARPFDLARGPLFRCVLYRLAPEEHVVLLAMHHVVVDGWSVGVMAEELASLYRAVIEGRPIELPSPALEYGDFAAWQQQHVLSEVLEQEFKFWQDQFDREPPVLELPADRPRPAEQSFEGALRSFELPADLSAEIHRLVRQERTTLFVTLMAAYGVVLGRLARQTDLAVGTVVANRTREELERVVGFFANTLALRLDLSGEPTFRELLRRVERVALGAYEHQELPFDKLVEMLDPQRYRNMAPLFQVALVLENMPLVLGEMAGVRAEPLVVDTGTAKYDVAFLVSENEGRIGGQVEYSTALFDEATIDRMIAALTEVLRSAVRDPETPVSRLAMLDGAERRRIVEQLSGERVDFGPPCPAHALFEHWAKTAPDRVALRCEDRAVTYGELDRRAERLARRLLSKGLQPEQPVAVCLERSVELVVALLGVLKSGGAYVPLDHDQPAERLHFLLEDTGASLVVTRGALAEPFRDLPTEVLLLDDVCLETHSDDPPEAAFARRVAPEQLAYVLYTSGSTGRPKGVLNEHRGLTNFVRAMSRALRVGPDDRVLHFFSPGFDGSITDIFVALANGACLVVVPPEAIRTEEALQDLARRERVTLATLTPSMLPLLRPEALPDLKTVCSVGEAITPELVARWSPGRRLINGYGVTEAACGACLMELDAASATAWPRVPIGRPLANVRMYVLDEHLEPAPLGVVGELCIGGVQVGRGYLNRPEQNARSFLPDPLGGDPAGRLYRTGDLGRLRPDGLFEFLGRMDDQVNLRGHRIEPGEIVAALESHPLVEQAAVVAREDHPGSPRLVAYVVPAGGDGLDDDPRLDDAERGRRRAARIERLRGALAEVRSHLKAELPAYMMPAAVVVLDALPRTLQGKLDRRALPPPSTDNELRRSGAVGPRDAEESLVAEVWEQLLDVRPVGVTDDFFELGGHSMLAVQVMAEIERRAGRRLPLASLFQRPTVEHLARLLRQPDACPAESSLILLQREGTGRPFFCLHPAGGTVFCYRDLAARLGADRPFYGLQAVGVDGTRPPHETVEAMIDHYVAAIRSVQPRGPYLIGGWSLGGNLAFETARVLAEQGEPIGLLAIFDAGALHADREPTQEDFLPMVMELFPDEDNLPLEAIQNMSPGEQLEYFAARAEQARIVGPPGGDGPFTAAQFEAARYVFEVFKTSMRAMIDYRQKPYPGKVTLFAAENRGNLFGAAADPKLGWDRWARDGVELHRIPGRHVHMVLEPHVRVLAERLRECLAEADRVGRE